MSCVRNDRCAPRQITSQSLPGSQTHVGGQAQPENVLALRAGNMMAMGVVMVVVGMAQVPPPGDDVDGVLRRVFKTGIEELNPRVRLGVLVGARREPCDADSVNGVEITESESHS